MKAQSKVVGIAAAILLVLTCLPTFAEVPRKRPLGFYAELWTGSLFSTQPPLTAEGQEIAKLKQQVKELQEAVDELKQPERKADPNAGKAASAPDPDLAAWIEKFRPQPISSQLAQAQLEQLANREAQRRGLVVKRRKILPIVEADGPHRARVVFEVSGREQVLYQWLDLLQSPADFRAVTSMTILPSRNDDTQVDCSVTIESWFIPEEEPETKITPADIVPLIDGAYNPMEVLLAVSKARPAGPLRIGRAEVLNQLDEEGTPQRSIRLHCLAEALEDCASFSRNLIKSAAFKGYRWNSPPPTEHPKTGQWQAMFEGNFAEEE